MLVAVVVNDRHAGRFDIETRFTQLEDADAVLVDAELAQIE